MRTRNEIEHDAEQIQDALGVDLLVEVLLDIRELNKQIEARLADAQANRNSFHVDVNSE